MQCVILSEKLLSPISLRENSLIIALFSLNGIPPPTCVDFFTFGVSPESRRDHDLRLRYAVESSLELQNPLGFRKPTPRSLNLFFLLDCFYGAIQVILYTIEILTYSLS